MEKVNAAAKTRNGVSEEEFEEMLRAEEESMRQSRQQESAIPGARMLDPGVKEDRMLLFKIWRNRQVRTMYALTCDRPDASDGITFISNDPLLKERTDKVSERFQEKLVALFCKIKRDDESRIEHHQLLGFYLRLTPEEMTQEVFSSPPASSTPSDADADADEYKCETPNQAFVRWFTGLSDAERFDGKVPMSEDICKLFETTGTCPEEFIADIDKTTGAVTFREPTEEEKQQFRQERTQITQEEITRTKEVLLRPTQDALQTVTDAIAVTTSSFSDI